MENQIFNREQQPQSEIMPEVSSEVMTIRNDAAAPTGNPSIATPSIESFVKETNKEQVVKTLSVSFTVTPKDTELKGIKLMEAVLKACEEAGADISNFSIRKDDKK